MELILASASPRRRELLTQCGLSFRVVSQPVDETLPGPMSPRDAVAYLSALKAKACMCDGDAQALIIGADTVVALDGEILGKPVGPASAQAMLHRLSGRTHEVFTGVTLWSGKQETTFVSGARVTFYPLSGLEISRYIATGEPMDKAGAYGIQGRGGLLVEKLEGDYYAVVGLPIARLMRELKQNYGEYLEEWFHEA